MVELQFCEWDLLNSMLILLLTYFLETVQEKMKVKNLQKDDLIDGQILN